MLVVTAVSPGVFGIDKVILTLFDNDKVRVH